MKKFLLCFLLVVFFNVFCGLVKASDSQVKGIKENVKDIEENIDELEEESDDLDYIIIDLQKELEKKVSLVELQELKKEIKNSRINKNENIEKKDEIAKIKKDIEEIEAKISIRENKEKTIFENRKKHYDKNENVIIEKDRIILILPPDMDSHFPYHFEYKYTKEKLLVPNKSKKRNKKGKIRTKIVVKIYRIRTLTYTTFSGAKKQVIFKVPIKIDRKPLDLQKSVYFY